MMLDVSTLFQPGSLLHFTHGFLWLFQLNCLTLFPMGGQAGPFTVSVCSLRVFGCVCVCVLKLPALYFTLRKCFLRHHSSSMEQLPNSSGLEKCCSRIIHEVGWEGSGESQPRGKGTRLYRGSPNFGSIRYKESDCSLKHFVNLEKSFWDCSGVLGHLISTAFSVV